jgi:hypothetical protein
MRGVSMKFLRAYVLPAVALAVAAALTGLTSCDDGATSPSPGVGYYVSPSGDDNNPGTEAAPWRTIGKAAATLVAGDTVYIRAGTYGERVVPRNSGASGRYITYAAYPGETPVIDGTGITLPREWGGLFDLTGKSFVKVSGLTVRNAGPHNNNVGILVDESSYIMIEDNHTNNTVSSGIGVWNSSFVTVDGNDVERACNDGEQECITVAGTSFFEVRNNHVHHGGPGSNGAEGIDAKDGSSFGKVHHNHVHDMNRLGIYVDAWDKETHTIEVYANRVHDCAGDGFTLASEAGGLLRDIKVYNNIAYNNADIGLGIYDYGEPGVNRHPMKGLVVINNTFYNNGRGNWGGGVVVENNDAEDVVIRNNICSNNLTFQIALEKVVASEVTVDHNLIHGFRGYGSERRGQNYVEGDPRFVNASAADFHLRSNSPAIDKGSATAAPSVDYEGNSRPRGAGYDIGAFEYAGGR